MLNTTRARSLRQLIQFTHQLTAHIAQSSVKLRKSLKKFISSQKARKSHANFARFFLSATSLHFSARFLVSASAFNAF
jgi:hypothetical protein